MQEKYSPIRLCVTLLALIFCIEGAMMFLVDSFMPKGTPIWVEAVIDAGVLTILVSVFVWRSFVKPLRFAMMSEAAQARTALDGAVEAIITIAEDGTIVSCNPAAERMFGYRSGELTAKNVKILMPEPHAGAHDGYIMRYVRTGEGHVIGRPRELDALRKDGTVFPIELSLTEFHLGGARRFTGIIRDITERRQATEAQTRLIGILDATPDFVAIADVDQRVRYLNPAARRLFALGKDEDASRVRISRSHPEWAARLVLDVGIPTAIREGMWSGDTAMLDCNGREVSMSQTIIAHKDYGGTVQYLSTIARDITGRKIAERQIERLSQMYAVLSNTNQAVVHARNEEELYDRISRIPIERGGLYGAVVRIANDERTLRAVSYSENMRFMVDKAVNIISPALPESGRFVATAYREDRIVINNDLIASDHAEPWLAHLRDAGVRSSASIPIRRQGRPIGVFSLNATESDFFESDMRTLLEEMAIDIAFALDNFEAERRRKQIEQALCESEGRFRGLVEQSLTGICIIEDGRFTYVNPRLAEIQGYTPQEMVGLQVIDTIAEEGRAVFRQNYHKQLSGEAKSVAYSLTARRKDGSTVRVGVNHASATMEGRPIVISMLQDISEREQAQRQIDAYIKQLEDAMLGTVTAVSAMVELRDPYTAGHELRVGLLAKAIGAEMGLAEQTCKGLEHIGRLHDLGKISIPAEILSRPGRLSELEFSIIKTHPQAGFDILTDVSFPWPVAMAILQHHERLDGSGYPNGTKGENIILEARILAVADVVEAMGSHRPYRATLGIDVALDEIVKFRGLRYDEKVVDACVRLFREKGFQLPQ